MKRGRILFSLIAALTGCAGLIGVPDLTFDENAEAGRPDGAPTGDGSSGGLDGPVNADAPIDAPVVCNADLTTDKAHCGACGHDCTQGLCADGLCTLMDQTRGAEALALDGNTLFIGFIGAGTFAGVASCPTSGCSGASVAPTHVTPVDAGDIEVFKIAVTPTHVFASDYYGSNGGGIVRVPRAGGPIERIGAGQKRSYGIALDSVSAYWTEGDSPGGVWQCPIGNCAAGVQKVVDTAFAAELLSVASNGAVFFTSNTEVLRCNSKSDCVTPIALPRRTGQILDMQRDGDAVYWAAGREVLSCGVAPTICANPTVVVPAVAGDVITAIAIQGGALYWATLPLNEAGVSFVNTDGVIKTCTIASCGASTRVIATKQLAPTAIVLDDKSVYWANNGRRNFTDGTGSVVKAPR